jgi:hypothetical protein
MSHHSLTDEQEAILRRGGLVLADLLDYHCRLPEWEDAGMFGDEYCAKCEHKGPACHMAALETPYLVYHFCAWCEQRVYDAAHPEMVGGAPERVAA